MRAYAVVALSLVAVVAEHLEAAWIAIGAKVEKQMPLFESAPMEFAATVDVINGEEFFRGLTAALAFVSVVFKAFSSSLVMSAPQGSATIGPRVRLTVFLTPSFLLSRFDVGAALVSQALLLKIGGAANRIVCESQGNRMLPRQALVIPSL